MRQLLFKGKGMKQMTVDVIIPTHKPQEDFIKLLDCLQRQTVKPEKIIIINTEEKYWRVLGEKFGEVIVHHIPETEFDHGNSRNLGVSLSQADYFMMMTQDAMPVDEFVIENLMKALADERTAVAYARQCPTKESNALECFIRSFNYGEKPQYKTEQDVEELGIKTYFCSNVCAMYKAEIFRQMGGFISRTIFNEDMIYAARAVKAGYAIQYVPAAAVYHAHNYTNRQQFRRNFDLGVSHADHPEVFDGLSSESEGVRMIMQTSKYLLKSGKPHLITKLFFQSIAKYIGYYLGKRYKKLPRKRILKYTMNKNYWK